MACFLGSPHPPIRGGHLFFVKIIVKAHTSFIMAGLKLSFRAAVQPHNRYVSERNPSSGQRGSFIFTFSHSHILTAVFVQNENLKFALR